MHDGGEMHIYMEWCHCASPICLTLGIEFVHCTENQIELPTQFTENNSLELTYK